MPAALSIALLTPTQQLHLKTELAIAQRSCVYYLCTVRKVAKLKSGPGAKSTASLCGARAAWRPAGSAAGARSLCSRRSARRRSTRAGRAPSARPALMRLATYTRRLSCWPGYISIRRQLDFSVQSLRRVLKDKIGRRPRIENDYVMIKKMLLLSGLELMSESSESGTLSLSSAAPDIDFLSSRRIYVVLVAHSIALSLQLRSVRLKRSPFRFSRYVVTGVTAWLHRCAPRDRPRGQTESLAGGGEET